MQMDEILENLENLVAYFIQRQHLVVLAMLDIHPRALRNSNNRILGIDLEPYLKIDREKFNWIRYSEDERIKHSLFRGIWKNDWEFFRHGIGCQLIHLWTDEPIEWDAPDPYAIDVYWFSNHLAWRLKHEASDPYVSQCQQWLKEVDGDLNDIKKVLYILIDKQILFLKQKHKCCLTRQRVIEQKPIPDEVVQATRNLIDYYAERQQIVISVMVELFPDVINIRATERFIDDGVANRLRALITDADTTFKGWQFTKGVWNDSWDYEIGHTRCTMVNRDTDERLSWAASDPAAIELHSFSTHLAWRIKNEPEDEDIRVCTEWNKERTQRYRPRHITANSETWLLNPHTFLDDLIEEEIIILKLDEYGTMIK
jgi:hypothetical protein